MMQKAECPQCEKDVAVGSHPAIGKVVRCDGCRVELEIVQLDPIELDWPLIDDDGSGEFDDYLKGLTYKAKAKNGWDSQPFYYFKLYKNCCVGIIRGVDKCCYTNRLDVINKLVFLNAHKIH